MHRKVDQLFSSSWRDTSCWPKPAAKEVKDEFKEVYDGRKRAVEQYMRGDSLKNIKDAEGIAAGELYGMLLACAERVANDQIAGFRALIPYRRRKRYERSSPANADALAAGRGSGGLFTQLLCQHVELQSFLIDQAKPYAKGDPKRRIPIGKEHGRFLNKLAKILGGTKSYPFTLQNRGREGFRKALHAEIQRLRGLGRGSLRTSIERAFRPEIDAPFRRVQIDAHKLDGFIRVRFIGRKRRSKTRALRPWLVAAVDVDSGACLGWTLSVEKEVSHLDLLRCLFAVMNPWKRRTQFEVENLMNAYEAGAGMPSILSTCAARYPDTISLDNALAHHADRIREVVLKRLHATLVLGLPGEPRTRAEIEQLFNTLTHRNVQHLVGGVRPNISDRERASAMKAVEEGGMTIDQMEEYLDVVICNYNAHPASAHYGKSPLQVLREEPEHTLIRADNSATANWRQLLKIELTVSVKGSGGHAPHINYLKADYSNNVLRAADFLVGKDVVITVDLTDLRTVEAKVLGGIDLGTLWAKGHWASFVHDERLRKRLNREIEDGYFHWVEGEDPEEIVANFLRRTRHSAAAQPEKSKPAAPPRRSEHAVGAPRLIADMAKTTDLDIEAILGAKLKG